MTAKLQIDAGGAEPIFILDLVPHVRQRHLRAAANEQFGGRDTAPRRPHDGDAFACDGERAIGRHLNFKVMRLKSAKMIARITKRVMTLGSLHPTSSKW
jgi:hypothetical protein